MNIMAFNKIYHGKKVLVTGHTGFKGSWLTEWLLQLGAKVSGYALEPVSIPSLFTQLGLEARIKHRIGNVCNYQELEQAVAEDRPDYIFHLAAQPLVRHSYSEPANTFATNCMGTVHLLDAVRKLNFPCTVIVITTDKCYENHEDGRAYMENSLLGGRDPYSASKAATEIIVSSYRRSFFDSTHNIHVATARAGNVIGGGDWASDRIVPDAIRALCEFVPIQVRNPNSTRPWQHVLEPLSGYLWLGAQLSTLSDTLGDGLSDAAFNFGPNEDANRTVEELVESMLKHWPGAWIRANDIKSVHEAKLLSLSIDKSYRLLSWKPALAFHAAVGSTIDWYSGVHRNIYSAQAITVKQITEYMESAKQGGILWAN